MATEFVGIPGRLMERVKEAATREEVSVEDLVCDALEQRVGGRADWVRTLEFGERNSRERGLKPEDVEREIAALRSERGR